MQPQRCNSKRRQPMTNDTAAHYDVLAFQGPRVVDTQQEAGDVSDGNPCHRFLFAVQRCDAQCHAARSQQRLVAVLD